jgi:tRNA A-37 threonylcarbamoyl transferase component Bud32
MHHPKHAILMPFEGPGILDHPTLTPEIGFDAGLALSQIHSLGTSHQDFAPWHVRVRDDGSVFFIDFSNLSMFDPHNLHAEIRDINLETAVAGLKMAHLTKITLSFEFSVLTLTVPGLRLRKVQNTSCF